MPRKKMKVKQMNNVPVCNSYEENDDDYAQMEEEEK